MAREEILERITIDPHVGFGKPCIRADVPHVSD